MGLLCLVSPPGYGKTTLMEYVANRLGLVFVKVNGPALGHEVTSVDPRRRPNATSRQEVEKINLALEMGNNVMLYSTTSSTRTRAPPEVHLAVRRAAPHGGRVERVERRTYDLRGKKFCVVMAGNPYTETGEKFRIPDMLANRADTYNLGDMLEGKAEAFALSYVENASRPTACCAARDARARRTSTSSSASRREEPIRRPSSSTATPAPSSRDHDRAEAPLRVQRRAAQGQRRVHPERQSQEDAYRTEPPFKLQGSYRNMNKMAEKVVAAMTTTSSSASSTITTRASRRP
jgi:hypothetical protein